MKSNLSFFLMPYAFGVTLRTFCLTQHHKDFSVIFSSWSFVDLALTFKSMIHFGLLYSSFASGYSDGEINFCCVKPLQFGVLCH